MLSQYAGREFLADLMEHTTSKIIPKFEIKEVDLSYKFAPFNSNNSILQNMYNSDTLIGIQDRKIKIIKQRDGERGVVNNINKLTVLISELLLNFIHPVYLPTLDEVIKEEIDNDIKNLLKKYIRETNHEVSKV
jgi:hypothetical protein